MRRSIPDFRLLLIGDGPERSRLEALAGGEEWIRFVGAMSGRQKSLHLATARLMLMPAAVGLGILDAFVFGLPVVSTDHHHQGPEFGYLEHGSNGIVTRADVEDYASGIVQLLQDPARLERMREHSGQDALHYSIEGMTERFVGGILEALAVPPAHAGIGMLRARKRLVRN